VEASDDVLAYIRQVLKQAGYGALTANNLSDGVLLLRATRPKVVIVGASVRAALEPRLAEFDQTANRPAVINLPADFSKYDAGAAGLQLLNEVRAVLGSGEGSVEATRG
jgi:hypothetical protein